MAVPAYLAAYDPVLAVTAVDRRGQVYRRANRGEHIDLAAPGVNVWTAASISGVWTKTGTSFAAPFVTAAAALIWQRDPSMTAADLRDRLRDAARDLGPDGLDAIFGVGLIAPPPPC
jgi:subtilisin family serine protease